MENGKIYYVQEGDFWMLGRALEVPKIDKSDNTLRGRAVFIVAGVFKVAKWCPQDIGRTYREANYTETQWFLECERQGKFIPKEQIKFYEVY